MKVLMVNKFHYIKGGSETYYFELKRVLEENGHEVIDFSMKDKKNFPSQYEKFFVENVDYNKNTSLKNKIAMASKIVYSIEAQKKIEELINNTRPDIVHLHIFQHQISPSIIKTIKKYNLPIVYTAHDLKMICPNYQMMTNGKICEMCKGDKFYQCLNKSCVKGSRIKSFISMSEAYLHKILKSYELIDTIITPSKFYKEKFIEFGVDSSKIIHLPNLLNDDNINIKKEREEEYLLYFGRISSEKGILTLIKAMKDIKLTLYIVGTGPLKDKINEFIQINHINNIKLLGFKKGNELHSIIGAAKAVIIPSEWYENGPYSAIESLKLGRPIIGSNLGGIPEVVEDEANGFIFKAGNSEDLNKSLKKLINLDKDKYKNFSKKSREKFEKEYNSKKHYNHIIKIYEELCTKQEKI